MLQAPSTLRIGSKRVQYIKRNVYEYIFNFVAIILKILLPTKLHFFHILKHCHHTYVSKEVGSLYFIEEKLTQAEQQHMSLLIWGLHFATFF